MTELRGLLASVNSGTLTIEGGFGIKREEDDTSLWYQLWPPF